MSPLLLKVAPRSRVKQEMARTSSMEAIKEVALSDQDIVTCSNNQSWDAFGDTVSPLLKVEKAGDDDSRADRGENKAEHEAPLPGEAQEHSSCHSHWRGMRRWGPPCLQRTRRGRA